MLSEKTIKKGFKLLGLANKNKRKEILNQFIEPPKTEDKKIVFFIDDNVTTPINKEELKNAKLE